MAKLQLNGEIARECEFTSNRRQFWTVLNVNERLELFDQPSTYTVRKGVIIVGRTCKRAPYGLDANEDLYQRSPR